MPHIFFKKLEKRRNTQTLVPFSSFNNLLNLEQQIGINSHYQIYDPDIYPSPFISYVDNPYAYMVAYYGLGVPYESPWAYPVFSPWDTWSPHWNSPWSSSYFPWDYHQDTNWSNNWLSKLVSNLYSLKSHSSSNPSSNPEPNIPLPDPDPPPDPGPWWNDPSYPPGALYGLIKRSNLLKV